MLNKFARLAGAALMVLGLAKDGIAGSTTSNLNISATVSQNCSISTTAVTFGSYDPVITNSSSGIDKTSGTSGTVVITCTKNSSGVWIGLGLGSHVNGTTRRMLGATNGDFLNYELYQPSATTPTAACPAGTGTVWGNTQATGVTPSGVTGWGASAAKTFYVCGLIAKGQDVSGTSAGESYSDLVVATVNF